MSFIKLWWLEVQGCTPRGHIKIQNGGWEFNLGLGDGPLTKRAGELFEKTDVSPRLNLIPV
jgi:hypothetical protein